MAEFPGQPNSARETGAIVSGDVDGDGDLDLVIGYSSSNHPNELLLNINGSYFEVAAGFPGGRAPTCALALR